MIGTNRYIGSPVERIVDPRFLRGRGQPREADHRQPDLPPRRNRDRRRGVTAAATVMPSNAAIANNTRPICTTRCF